MLTAQQSHNKVADPDQAGTVSARRVPVPTTGPDCGAQVGATARYPPRIHTGL